MRKTSRSILTTSLFFVSISAWGQTNACDLAAPFGVVDAADVQAAINMSLGVSPCTANIAGPNACNVMVVQRVINASMGGGCTTSTGLHVVVLNWTPSSNVAGYKVYRSTTSGGPYTLRQTVMGATVSSFTDNTVVSGQTYYYVITSLDSANAESSYSNQTQAIIPTP
jgi:hypothetical protein